MSGEPRTPSRGYREQLKAVTNLADAKVLMAEIRRNCPERYVKRCQRVYDQLPFTKEAA